MIVKFHKDVEDYLVDLIEILYEKEYFGFKESATDYVRELVYEIQDSLNRKHKKTAPTFFSKYDDNLQYVIYQKNRNTQWYVFFNRDGDTYCVYYIANNHSVGQYL